MTLLGWALAFLFTLVVETPVYFLSLRRVFGGKGAMAASLLLNIATHPIAWSTLMATHRPFPYVFLAVEGAVILIEGLLLFAAGRSRFARQPIRLDSALAISLAANGFSAGLGLLL
jgi:hypothetical protein